MRHHNFLKAEGLNILVDFDFLRAVRHVRNNLPVYAHPRGGRCLRPEHDGGEDKIKRRKGGELHVDLMKRVGNAALYIPEMNACHRLLTRP